MDWLFSLQGIAACIVLLGGLLVLIAGLLLPKQRRVEVLHRVGRWFQ